MGSEIDASRRVRIALIFDSGCGVERRGVNARRIALDCAAIFDMAADGSLAERTRCAPIAPTISRLPAHSRPGHEGPNRVEHRYSAADRPGAVRSVSRRDGAEADRCSELLEVRRGVAALLPRADDESVHPGPLVGVDEAVVDHGVGGKTDGDLHRGSTRCPPIMDALNDRCGLRRGRRRHRTTRHPAPRCGERRSS